jgi:tetratricopeptide (TPR) repeat protein
MGWLVVAGLLIALCGYLLYQRSHDSSIREIEQHLAMREDEQAIRRIESHRGRFGDRADLHFLAARAYRHLGEEPAFAKQLEIAKSLGYAANRLEFEQSLLAAQTARNPNFRSQLAGMLIAGSHELDEVFVALVQGVFAAQRDGDVEGYLQMWESHDPGSPWPATFRCRLALTSKDFHQALRFIQPVADRYPNFVPAYLMLGDTLSGLQQSDRAIVAYQRYKDSNPSDPLVAISLSKELSTVGKAQEGLIILEKFVGTERDSFAIRMQLGNLYLECDRPEKTIETMSEIAQTWPEDVAVANLMSQAYYRTRDNSNATRMATIARDGQLDVQSIDARLDRLRRGVDTSAMQCYELGHIYLHKQSREHGFHWLMNALEKDVRLIPVHEDLAIYFDRTHRPDLAARHRQFVESNQNGSLRGAVE